MIEYIKEYVRAKASEKRMGIFGTGKMASVAETLLCELGIKKYVYFDNDATKWDRGESAVTDAPILSPLEITKDDFILVSTIYFEEIRKQLESIGLKEWDNYIWALELDYYDALLCYQDVPRVPEISNLDLEDLEYELSLCTEVKKIEWFDENEFLKYEERLGFEKKYDKENNRRYRRKIMEYFVVDRLLQFDKWEENLVYVDVGAAGSPFAKYLRERGIKAFALDLNKGNYGELPYYIQEDATKMHWGNNEVSAISMQSAFEMFAGDADMNFIREAARVLNQGGKVVICPLYLHKQYLSTVSPNYYHSGMADEGSLECIRVDCRGGIPLARFYSVDAFNNRVLKTAKRSGLKPTIWSLPSEIVEKDEFVYLKFILELEKIYEESVH